MDVEQHREEQMIYTIFQDKRERETRGERQKRIFDDKENDRSESIARERRKWA